MKLVDVKPGASYETYDGDVWLVLKVVSRGPGTIKFHELLLVGQAAGAIQEAAFHTDSDDGSIRSCRLLAEGP